jgi:hypothetical protein
VTTSSLRIATKSGIIKAKLSMSFCSANRSRCVCLLKPGISKTMKYEKIIAMVFTNLVTPKGVAETALLPNFIHQMTVC